MTADWDVENILFFQSKIKANLKIIIMWTGELGEIKQSLKVMKKYNSALDVCAIKKGILLLIY